MIGLIAGTVQIGEELSEKRKLNSIETPYGIAIIEECDGYLLVDRHMKGTMPPHMVDHRSNIWALADRCDHIIGICSAGSMNRGIPQGTLVVCDDYIHLDPPTFFDDKTEHIVPVLSTRVRTALLDAAGDCGTYARNGAVYYQSKGPRLETRAEVRMLADHADLVGMSAASEASLAQELGAEYGFICSVDNWANGISADPLSQAGITTHAKRNQKTIAEIVETAMGAR